MITPDYRAYFQSLADEIRAQSKRVRNLIGDRHWGVDGSHKEFLLSELVRRHMPNGVLVARGFAAQPPLEASTEQDLLIVDTRNEGPLFFQGGTVIALPGTILAAVSVKTKPSASQFVDATNGLNSVREICAMAGFAPPFTAALFFEDDGENFKRWIDERGLEDSDWKGADVYATSDSNLVRVDRSEGRVDATYYKCDKMATAVLLALLGDAVTLRMNAMVQTHFSDAFNSFKFDYAKFQIGSPVTPPNANQS